MLLLTPSTFLNLPKFVILQSGRAYIFFDFLESGWNVRTDPSHSVMVGIEDVSDLLCSLYHFNSLLGVSLSLDLVL